MNAPTYTVQSLPGTAPPEIAVIAMAYRLGRTGAQKYLKEGIKFVGAYEMANATGFEQKTLQWQAAMLAAQHYLDAHHITLDMHGYITNVTSNPYSPSNPLISLS